MSKFSHRPRGGQMGIEVTAGELNEFVAAWANIKLLPSENVFNHFIPIPGKTVAEQKPLLKECLHKDEVYWETDQGRHGWCCSNCGKVTQWG